MVFLSRRGYMPHLSRSSDRAARLSKGITTTTTITGFPIKTMARNRGAHGGRHTCDGHKKCIVQSTWLALEVAGVIVFGCQSNASTIRPAQYIYQEVFVARCRTTIAACWRQMTIWFLVVQMGGYRVVENVHCPFDFLLNKKKKYCIQQCKKKLYNKKMAEH